MALKAADFIRVNYDTNAIMSNKIVALENDRIPINALPISFGSEFSLNSCSVTRYNSPYKAVVLDHFIKLQFTDHIGT